MCRNQEILPDSASLFLRYLLLANLLRLWDTLYIGPLFLSDLRGSKLSDELRWIT
ncbi:MAG: hypothetical protein J6386_14370 [Candidatus Synoicihabitans palmerolidicus]|nr:hypothetical protein [Candidatus Synoicihabitans palmerolidicus]